MKKITVIFVCVVVFSMGLCSPAWGLPQYGYNSGYNHGYRQHHGGHGNQHRAHRQRQLNGGDRYASICRQHAISSIPFPGQPGAPICPH